MIETIGQYKMRKLIYETMFNLETVDYSEDPSMFSLVVMESLRNIVGLCVSQNILSRSVKDNIFDFLNQARNYIDGDRSERIDLVNETIKLLNSQEKDELLSFYRFQLYDRTKELKYLFKATNEEIIDEIKYIHESICNDLFVVITHTSEVSDFEFINEYLPELKDNSYYYESLNIILKEYPYIFKNLTFYNRMMCVLNYNNEIDEEVFEYNKKLVKKINRKIKRLK